MLNPQIFSHDDWSGRSPFTSSSSRRIRTSKSIRITQSSSWREQTLSVCDGQIDENRCQYRCKIHEQHGNNIHDKAGFKSRLKCHITRSENRRTDHVCFTHYRDYSRREQCAANCGTNDVSFRSAPSEVPDQDGRGAPKYVSPRKNAQSRNVNAAISMIEDLLSNLL
jgi:hypothetical protein